jgi:phosphatidylinositol alpha-mannosyltransferase
LRAQYEQAIAPDLRGRVRFLGAVYGERPDLFASSDLMVIPARAIGFSIMVLESFAAGLPVVALPALGVGQAGDHWRNVLLAAEPTAESLATALLGALDADHGARVCAGRAIAADYDWSAVGPRILEVFDRAVRNPRRPSAA